MKTVSLVNSISRRAGGLFVSVRRLDLQLRSLSSPSPPQHPSPPPSSHSTRDLHISVLAARDDCSSLDLPSWAPLSVQTFPSLGPSSFNFSPALSRRLHLLNPDLLHVHGLWQFTSLAALLWHRRSAKPYIVSPHGMLDPWALRLSHWKKRLAWCLYEKPHLQSAACIRALCIPEAQAIRALGLSNPICVIPNGVDITQPSTTSTPVPGGPNDWHLAGRNILLYFGRLHPKKNLPALLRAWALALNYSHNWTLVIAGWDQLHHLAHLKNLASHLSLPWSDSPAHTGPVPSVCFIGPQFGSLQQLWWRACHAFILPSLSEGLPMAVLEAWSHAKPVLISDPCNLPQGFAAHAAFHLHTDPHRIAQSLRLLFSASPATLRSMGRRGHTLVANHFSWDSAARSLKNVYDWILNAAPKPPSLFAN